MESLIYQMPVSPQLVVKTFFIVLLTLPYRSSSAYLLNQTGGSFPNSVYQQSTFSYNFVVPTVSVSYYGPSSSVGKCNLMGYWHTLNGGAADSGVLQSTKNRDQLICTDKCTFLTCGYNPTKNVTFTIAGKKYIGLTIRPDSKSRTPLTDFGASDGLLSAADYLNFPDLQMLPALAGAVVPIYNIPELGKSNITTPLILSRSSLVNIFMGNITSWNDPSILLDNAANERVVKILQKVTAPISIVVRTDSSGTSEVFTTALGAMSPSGVSITQSGPVPSTENSFYDQIIPRGPSQTPKWCGFATDELQYMTVTQCPFSSSSPSLSSTLIPKLIPSRALHMMIVDNDYNLQNVSFNCDFNAYQIKSVIFSATALNVHILITNLTSISNINKIQIEIGYDGKNQQGKDMYNPIMVSSPLNVGVSIKAKQEGGYVNAVTACILAPSTLQVSSLWLNKGKQNQFKLQWKSGGNVQSTGFIIYSGSDDISAAVKVAINSIVPSAVSTVTMITRGSWTEFQILFSHSVLSTFSSLSIQTANKPNSVYIGSLTDYDNYPCFYDTANVRGYLQSGRYTCYKRQTNFRPWYYYSGNSNSGVVAEVLSRPYSIGYSVLEIALSQLLPTASLINKAGYVVKASSSSVSFAVMGVGGSLNDLFQASLADASSSEAWPISGLTYFIIRNKHHIEPNNCARRSLAMEYLYHFYSSVAVERAALQLGFAILPRFIVETVQKYLLDNAFCENGNYALNKYRIKSSPIYGLSAFEDVIAEYLNAYASIYPAAVWSPKYTEDSDAIWADYIMKPEAVTSVFTMFVDKNEKLANYNDTHIITSSFANVAVVFIYHLNAYSDLNLLTGNKGDNAKIQLTAEIVGGIFAGKITTWNDSKIQKANPLTSKYLPNQLINVVVRPDVCDTNGLLLRFLITKSKTFLKEYKRVLNTQQNNVHHDDHANVTKQFNFSTLIPNLCLKNAWSNDRVDSVVTTFDGSFGYYLHYSPPSSSIANYCLDDTCSGNIINPSLISSIVSCQNDVNTIINPNEVLNTYDLMSSTDSGCYPIVGTIDYSLTSNTNSLTCHHNKLYDNNAYGQKSSHSAHDEMMFQNNTNSVLKDRLSLSSWLYSSPIIVQPLAINSIFASSTTIRASTYKKICDIKCNNVAVGYEYCGYRDCSWLAGDYNQKISNCDPVTGTHTVTYELILGADSTCIQNTNTIPPSSIIIGCTDVQSNYRYGKLATSLSIIGMVVCASVLIFVIINRKEKVIVKSQAVFIYIFIVGAFFMNFSILTLVGPNSDRNCLLRVWAFDISSTIMFAPLLMKLHRIDMLFRMSKKLKKLKINDAMVALQVSGIVLVDVFILTLWTILNRPRQRSYFNRTGGLYVPVEYTQCSTGLDDRFEQSMLAWKAILLAAGVYKSICTWDMPSDLAEVKHFFLAIYNVTVVGGAMYFFSIYGSSSEGVFIILRCIGIFVSATLPVLIIMIPKFIAIQYKILTGKNLWAQSKIAIGKLSSSGGQKESKSEGAPNVEMKGKKYNSSLVSMANNLRSLVSSKIQPQEQKYCSNSLDEIPIEVTRSSQIENVEALDYTNDR